MKRIIEWLCGLKADKLLHFIAGVVVSQIIFGLLDLAMPMWWCALLSLLAAAIVGGIKEAIDVKHGVPNIKDWVATFFGGVLGVILAILITL